MYSAVLMLALTAGSESVDFGRRGGCGGGCGGGVYAGCVGSYGGGYGCTGSVVSYGCSGYSSSYGCCGGGRGGLFGRRGGRGGCCGGGGVVSYGCTGGYYGGCTGGAYHGGCTGGVYHGGCTGGIYQGGVYQGGTIVNPAPKTMPNPPETAPAPKKGVQAAAPANIIVSLPANATLTFDGAPTTSTSEQRSFVTPVLEPGSTYVYTLRAMVNNVEQTQQVTVRGGETSTVQFNFPSQGVASR